MNRYVHVHEHRNDRVVCFGATAWPDIAHRIVTAMNNQGHKVHVVEIEGAQEPCD